MSGLGPLPSASYDTPDVDSHLTPQGFGTPRHLVANLAELGMSKQTTNQLVRERMIVPRTPLTERNREEP